MTSPSFVVGAYASLPEGWELQREYYRLLGEQSWIHGAELPYPGNLADYGELTWLSMNLPKRWHRNTVTLIPGTMQRVWKDASFGLASPDPEGRAAAVELVRDAWKAIMRLADARGVNDVTFVEIHSAPTRIATAASMCRSIEELMTWDWGGSRLVVEHCDRYVEGRRPEKGFLSIEDEIVICRRTGVGLTVNWGRSCVEGRDAATPLAHVRAACENGVLRGLMFSGAGPDATQYGYEWIDGHLPMTDDESGSLMDDEAVYACAETALNAEGLEYLGAKVCVPKELDLEGRLEYLARIHRATRVCDAGEALK